MASEKRCRYSTPWWKLKLPSDEPPFCVRPAEEDLWKSVIPAAHQADVRSKPPIRFHVEDPALDLRVLRRPPVRIEIREENMPVPDDNDDFQDQIVPSIDLVMDMDGNAVVPVQQVEDQEVQNVEEANNGSREGHVMEDQLPNRTEEAGVQSQRTEQQAQSSGRGENLNGQKYRIIEILTPPLEGTGNRSRIGYFIQKLSQPLEQTNSRAGTRHGVVQQEIQRMETDYDRCCVTYYVLKNEREDYRIDGIIVTVSHKKHKERNEVAARICFVKDRVVLMVEANNSAGVILEGELLTLPMAEVNNSTGVRFKGVELQLLHIDDAKSDTITKHNLLDQSGGLILTPIDGTRPRHYPSEQDQQIWSVIEGHSGTVTEREPLNTVQVSLNLNSVWDVTYQQWYQFFIPAVLRGIASPSLLEQVMQLMRKLRIKECCNTPGVRSVIMAVNIVSISQSVEDANNRTGTGLVESDLRERAVEESTNRASQEMEVDQEMQPMEGGDNRASTRYGSIEHQAQPVDGVNNENRSRHSVVGVSEQREQHTGPIKVGDFYYEHRKWALIRIGAATTANTGQPMEEANDCCLAMQEVLEQHVQVNQQAESMEDVSNRFDARNGLVEHQAELPGEVNNDNCNRQSTVEQQAQNVQVRHMIGANSTNENVEHQQPQLIQGVNSAADSRVRAIQQQVPSVAGANNRAGSDSRGGEQCVQPMEGANREIRTGHRDEEQRSQVMGGAVNRTFAILGEQIVHPVQGHSNETGVPQRIRELGLQPIPTASNLVRERQRILQQEIQSSNVASDRPDNGRAIPMDEDYYQLPDSTVDENGEPTVEPRMHWLCTYTDNEAEGVVLRDICPQQQNRPRANEAAVARDRQMTLRSGSAQAEPSAQPGCSYWPSNAAQPSGSSRPDNSAQAAVARDRQMTLRSGSAQAGPSAQPGCSFWPSNAAQPSGSSRPDNSAQIANTREQQNLPQPGPSTQTNSSTLAVASAGPSGSSQTAVSVQQNASVQSVQPGESSMSNLSSMPDVSVQPGGSSQPGGSAQSHGSSNTGGPAMAYVSSQLGVSAQPGGSGQPAASSQSSGLSQPDVSVHPGGPTQCNPPAWDSSSDGSSVSDEAGPIRYRRSPHPRVLTYAFPDASETSESETTDSEDFPLLRGDGADLTMKAVFSREELQLTSNIFKLTSVPDDADIRLYMPTEDESEEDKEINQLHPTSGQVSDGKELNVQQDKQTRKSRPRKKKAPAKSKPKVQRKKRRRM